MMTTETDLLEQIVRDVMRQLASMPGEVCRDDSGLAAKTNGTVGTNELSLSENVITAELLSQRFHGAAHLSIGPAAVLTPSARDWLREHDITWRRQAGGKTPSSTNSGHWKVIVERATPAVTAALDRGTATSGDRWNTQNVDDFQSAVDAVVSALCRAEADGVVLFTNQPAAAACRGNRNRKVRAAVVMGKACVRAACRQMGANLLCIDPTGRTVWELKTILRELERGGRPTHPEDWRE